MEPLLFRNGNNITPAGSPAGMKASMEPLLFRNGNIENGIYKPCNDKAVRASMEPLLFRNGNDRSSTCGSDCC